MREKEREPLKQVEISLQMLRKDKHMDRVCYYISEICKKSIIHMHCTVYPQSMYSVSMVWLLKKIEDPLLFSGKIDRVV